MCQKPSNKELAYFESPVEKYLTDVHWIKFRNQCQTTGSLPEVCSFPALSGVRGLRNLFPFPWSSVGSLTQKQIIESAVFCFLSVVTENRCFVFLQAFLKIYRRKLKSEMFLSSGRAILKIAFWRLLLSFPDLREQHLQPDHNVYI